MILARIVVVRIGNLTTSIPGFAWTAKRIFLPRHLPVSETVVLNMYLWAITVNNTNQTIDVASEYSTEHYLTITLKSVIEGTKAILNPSKMGLLESKGWFSEST